MTQTQPYVTYAKTIKCFSFNSRMMRELALADMEHVKCGVDRASGIVVLQQCDAEDFGSTCVRIPYTVKDATEKQKEQAKQHRYIRVGPLLEDLGIEPAEFYKAERVGRLIYLQDVTNGAAK